MKNLLYLTNGREDWGSTRYRALQWISFLEKRGWNVEWIFSRHIRFRKFIKIIKMCYWADIVVVQKKTVCETVSAFNKDDKQEIDI